MPKTFLWKQFRNSQKEIILFMVISKEILFENLHKIVNLLADKEITEFVPHKLLGLN